MNLLNILAESDLCTSEAGYRLFGLTGYVLNAIQIAIPIILILMGTIDLVKALVAQKDDDMKKAQSILIKRAIYAIVIFFVPMVIKFVMSMVGNSSNNVCMESFSNPKEALAKANEIKNNLSGSGTNSGYGEDVEILSREECESQGKDWQATIPPGARTNCVYELH